ncbi:MAG: hypothetical protein JW730_03665 [Anaerolineales bacterium]|nr:hypothetical protein [Anaerolineales bacterium]
MKDEVTTFHIEENKEVTIYKQMASTSKKQLAQSPKPHYKSRKTNKVNSHPLLNDELTVVGIGASAAEELETSQEERQTVNKERKSKLEEITRAHREL